MVSRQRSLFDRDILGPAIVASFKKLDPRVQFKNPVMFICEVGALVTLLYAARDAGAHNGQLGFDVAISIWLWFTVLFANFAEAVA
jgi:K+-transporting ATPase ATPase B chain